MVENIVRNVVDVQMNQNIENVENSEIVVGHFVNAEEERMDDDVNIYEDGKTDNDDVIHSNKNTNVDVDVQTNQNVENAEVVVGNVRITEKG